MEATRTATDELRTNIPSFPARVEEEKVTKQDKLNETAEIINEISQDKKPEKKYVFPPVTLLKSCLALINFNESMQRADNESIRAPRLEF